MKSSKHTLCQLRPSCRIPSCPRPTGFVIRHLLPVLLLALAACTDTAPLAPGTNANPEDTPLIPVTFSLSLQGTQAPGTRSNTRADGDGTPLTAAQIAAIPADGEITMDTEFEYGLAMYLPGVTNTGDLLTSGDNFPACGYYYLKAPKDATLTTPAWQYKDQTGSYTTLPALYMKDFSHNCSRLGLVTFKDYRNYDELYAITERTRQGAGLTYQYLLRHATAKVSLLLQDKDHQPIPYDAISNVSINSYGTISAIASIGGQPLLPYLGPTRSISPLANDNPTWTTFYSWANSSIDAEGNLPGPNDLEMTYESSNSDKFDFNPPASNDASSSASGSSTSGSIPVNLWNALIEPNPTHTKTSGLYARLAASISYNITDGYNTGISVTTIATGGTYPKAAPGYTGGSGSTGSSDQPICVAPYLDADDAKNEKMHCITVILADGGSALPAGTYRIPLSSIALTGLPENDARRTDFVPNGNSGLGSTGTDNPTGTGTLKYLLPGEHLLVVLTLDRQQGLTATASIGSWSLTEVDLGNLDDMEDTGGEVVPAR